MSVSLRLSLARKGRRPNHANDERPSLCHSHAALVLFPTIGERVKERHITFRKSGAKSSFLLEFAFEGDAYMGGCYLGNAYRFAYPSFECYFASRKDRNAALREYIAQHACKTLFYRHHHVSL